MGTIAIWRVNMRKISDFIVKHHILIFIVGILLLIPSVIGYINTRINYDILVYLPEKVDTIKGQHILAEEFHLGSFAFVMIDDSRIINISMYTKRLISITLFDFKCDGIQPFFNCFTNCV